METKPYEPTEAELEILQVIWDQQPVTVRAVYDQIITQKEVGYTTVLKQIQRLTEKGVLEKTEAAGIQRYCCLLEEKEVKTGLLDKVIQSAFGGSALQMMLHALGSEKTSEAELLQLKNWLDQQTKHP